MSVTQAPPAEVLADIDQLTDVYDEMVELADEHLQRPVSTTLDTWEDGTFRIRIYHQIAPEKRESLYYNSDEGEVHYGVEAADELKDHRVIKTVEPPSGSK